MYYFVSDVHLGAISDPDNLREKAFVEFLRSLPKETKGLYMLGDIFDFWVEYQNVAPRGFVRVLGELAALHDRGVELWMFCGNHDYWFSDYLKKEIGLNIVYDPWKVVKVGDMTMCLGHGDGVGKHRLITRLVFHFFRSPFNIALLKFLHPYLIFQFAHKWSEQSRAKHRHYTFQGENDPIYKFAAEHSASHDVDAYVFGHLHSPAQVTLPCGSKLFVLNDWKDGANYLHLSGMNIEGFGLKKIEK